MPKSLNDILKGVKKSTTEPLTTGNNPGVDYADKMKDTRDFVAQHTIEKHADRVGNENPAAKIKQTELKRHGNVPAPKDIKTYNKNQQVGQPENSMKEAKACESCGKSPCGCDSDDEPRYGKKDKAGKRKLLTDKNIQEKLTKGMSAGEVIKDFQKSDDPRFAGDSKEKRKKRALAAYYKVQREDVNESISDQRSSRKTASEEARKEIHKSIVRKKEKDEKMKEEAAAAEVPITFPVTNSREGFRV